MVIAVDFDGTCVTHEFPEIGQDIGAAPVLRKLVEHGHQIILYTMRSNRHKERKTLTEARNWFFRNKIAVWGVNKNPTQKRWTGSPKAYAHLYIDDAALGIPLVKGVHKRPYVNWAHVEVMLASMGYFISTNKA